jgi:hypothetical protein
MARGCQQHAGVDPDELASRLTRATFFSGRDDSFFFLISNTAACNFG